MRSIVDTTTVQQLDPLGTLDGRPAGIVAVVGSLVFSVVVTANRAGQIEDPFLANAALFFIAVSAVLYIVTTSPIRPPFSGGLHALIVGLLIIAFALSSASIGSGGALLTDFWGPLVIGVMCMALAPYRPIAELVTLGIVASIFTGFIGLVQSSVADVAAPPMIVVLFTMTPVLTMSLGGAAFARSLASTHKRWEARARRAARRQLDREHDSVARSVQQDRVTILNRDVVPLFTELAQRGIVSPEDRARAAQYSESIRSLMVSEVNRSWLESVVATSFGALDDGRRVQDPQRLATAMTPHQRTALRAAVLAVASGTDLIADTVRLRIEKTPTGAAITVTGSVGSNESSWRSTLAPYIAVLRVVFTGLRISYRSPSLTVRFTYDTP
ncbi:hypothetical protein CLV85_2039 [Salinibacterium amurskyense]|uniref:Signal transduction histidine kinase n=1 Tax=Salinibacterium amurskyense TaxID=205941 RepID=A0A2M9D2Q9_9MICO|nr:hypothetical protein [Salinibacterium amurskyense]PJJ78466.1 hypothetical protein CLV85_2039 [Salinibacterium amurskyense]RLQ80564.1 hypothetical protein D9C83_10120 [Salinibacterium amurskyense]GHD83183.1 hypothetical protein GCM10007394_22060 [Salinibacterium amurskyense]